MSAPGAQAVKVDVLFNPKLRSADFMVPAEVGMIMLWVGTVATAATTPSSNRTSGAAVARRRATMRPSIVSPASATFTGSPRQGRIHGRGPAAQSL